MYAIGLLGDEKARRARRALRNHCASAPEELRFFPALWMKSTRSAAAWPTTFEISTPSATNPRPRRALAGTAPSAWKLAPRDTASSRSAPAADIIPGRNTRRSEACITNCVGTAPPTTVVHCEAGTRHKASPFGAIDAFVRLPYPVECRRQPSSVPSRRSPTTLPSSSAKLPSSDSSGLCLPARRRFTPSWSI